MKYVVIDDETYNLDTEENDARAKLTLLEIDQNCPITAKVWICPQDDLESAEKAEYNGAFHTGETIRAFDFGKLAELARQTAQKFVGEFGQSDAVVAFESDYKQIAEFNDINQKQVPR